MPVYDENPLCVVADSAIHGRGLFARVDIRAGTLIGHYQGPRTNENGMHVLWVEEDGAENDGWAGYDGRNELRFLNHSARPNGEMDGRDLYARTAINAGEEITIHYGEEFEAECEDA